MVPQLGMKTVLSWSSGKDSAWALQVLKQRPDVELVGLLTTVNVDHQRVAMHAVRRELLRAQAESVRLPLREILIPQKCTNEAYEAAMGAAMAQAREDGVQAVAFGDLFLEDIRAYREKQMAPTGLSPLFPLWGRPTGKLAQEMIAGGLRARLTCVDPRQLDASAVGQAFSGSFLDALPPSVDPCGENGEFHTFAWDGPMFEEPVRVTPGEVTQHDGFWFADLLPGSGAAPDVKCPQAEEPQRP